MGTSFSFTRCLMRLDLFEDPFGSLDRMETTSLRIYSILFSGGKMEDVIVGKQHFRVICVRGTTTSGQTVFVTDHSVVLPDVACSRRNKDSDFRECFSVEMTWCALHFLFTSCLFCTYSIPAIGDRVLLASLMFFEDDF